MYVHDEMELTHGFADFIALLRVYQNLICKQRLHEKQSHIKNKEEGGLTMVQW